MSQPTETALAFDFGTQRMGLAWGQNLTASATELPPLPARDGIPDWDRIAALIAEWRPDCLVVGLPLNMDGSISDMARRARKFANRLHERFRLPCYLIDERLTSHAAKALHRASGGSQHYRKDPVDSIAARLLLEDWLRSEVRIPSHTPLETLYGNGQPEC